MQGSACLAGPLSLSFAFLLSPYAQISRRLQWNGMYGLTHFDFANKIGWHSIVP